MANRGKFYPSESTRMGFSFVFIDLKEISGNYVRLRKKTAT